MKKEKNHSRHLFALALSVCLSVTLVLPAGAAEASVLSADGQNPATSQPTAKPYIDAAKAASQNLKAVESMIGQAQAQLDSIEPQVRQYQNAKDFYRWITTMSASDLAAEYGLSSDNATAFIQSAQEAYDLFCQDTVSTGSFYEGTDTNLADNVNYSDSNDAVSVDSVQEALTTLQVDYKNCKLKYRDNSEYHNKLVTAYEGVTIFDDFDLDTSLNYIDVTVTPFAMAWAEMEADWASTNYTHSYSSASGMIENLAWGYSDPYVGWVDQETDVLYQYRIDNPDVSADDAIQNVGMDCGHLNAFVIHNGPTGLGVKGSTYCEDFVETFDSDADAGVPVATYRQMFEDYLEVAPADAPADLQSQYTSIVTTLHNAEKALASAMSNYNSAMSDLQPYLNFSDVQNPESYYMTAVCWADEFNITSGVSDGIFSPNGTCTRAQFVSFLYRASGAEATDETEPFTDVSEDAYYYDAVRWCYNQQIVSGVSETSFSPNAPVTRAQVASFIYRYEQKPAVTNTIPFTDVKQNAYYYDAVRYGYANGIIAGTSETTFEPNSPCTRAQTVCFLYRTFTD